MYVRIHGPAVQVKNTDDDMMLGAEEAKAFLLSLFDRAKGNPGTPVTVTFTVNPREEGRKASGTKS